jgi:integrase
MCCLGFFGFFRISEMTFAGPSFNHDDGLTPSDITLPDGRVTILLRRSKTDKRREGVTVTLSENPSPVCPRKALSHYLRQRAARFPHLCPRTTPLFLTLDGKPIDKPCFSSRLADLSKKIGLRGKVTPHSLRIGAATAAWGSGFSDSQIQSMGRWKSRSFERYLRVDADMLASLSARLGSS